MTVIGQRGCLSLLRDNAVRHPLAEGYAIILWAIQLNDGVNCVASRTPYDLLERIAQRIRDTQPKDASVQYDVTP